MSRPAGNCPQCGAKIEFQFSCAVQTVCEFCRSIVVRRDVDLALVGKVATLPPDSSPIQMRSEGIWGNKAFHVAGRIIYQYEFGGWNEWHLVFQDGKSGWLSDAQADFTISFAFTPPEALPAAGDLSTGRSFEWNGIRFSMTSITEAHYAGVEGELPFEYWDKSEVKFADLRSTDAHFATIDYSEEPPLLFVGESVTLDQLRMKNLRSFEGW
jgi:hypothetical protein